MKLTDGMA